MIITIKAKLYPNKQQEQLFMKSCGIMRFAYNWALNKRQEHYQATKETIKCSDLRKEFTQLRHHEDYQWLVEVSSEIPQQAIKDMDKAYKGFFKNIASFPRYKTRKSKLSFYHSNAKIKVMDNKIYLEKIGWMRIKDDNRLPRGNYKRDKITVYNPRISYNGKYWQITIGVEQEEKSTIITDEVIGIDLGVKDFAICSNGDRYKNINKTKRVKQIKKRLKRKQRQVSRKYDNLKMDKTYKKGEKPKKTMNIIKLEQEIKRIHARLNNIRTNYLHQTSNRIVKTKPCKIVIENLNVKGMMKNKHLAEKIAEQNFYRFTEYLTYKAERNGIQLVKAGRFFPSSKMCSNCGCIKHDLKLKDRIYHCEHCQITLDRDFNASINLRNYCY